MKKVLILGSTGSIGRNVLNVISRHRDKFKVVGISAKKNFKLLEKQAKDFDVPYVGIVDFNKEIKFKNSKIFFKEEGLLELIELTKPDILINSVVGISGLKPLFYAIDTNIPYIAVANKESIVVGGEFIKKKLSNKKNIKLLPLDSEHSALHQCLKDEKINNVKSVVITASGGPLFKNKSKKKNLKNIISHPIWKMGKKISVDSATMVNKGFEYIETHYLFDLPYEKIKILIHPEAIIHSFVEFVDGSILACLFSPDMRIPISYALGCLEERIENLAKNIDLLMLNKINIYKPDYKNFPLLKILIDIAKSGQNSYLIFFNAANEVLVDNFINNKISFDDIYKVMKSIILNYKPQNVSSVEEIFEIDRSAREVVNRYLNKN